MDGANFPAALFRAAGVAAVALLLVSCSESPQVIASSHSGDLGHFILRSVEQYGGHPKATNSLPRLEGVWAAEILQQAEHLQGREQLSIRAPRDLFQDITNYLARAFGPPSQPTVSTNPDVACGYYSIGDIGVGLQFYRDNKEAGLIIVGVRRK